MSVWVTKSWSGRAEVAGGMPPLSFSAAGVGAPDTGFPSSKNMKKIIIICVH
jgi:hypothetical protein